MAIKSAFEANESAVPLMAGNSDPGNFLVEWAEHRAKQMARLTKRGPGSDDPEVPKVRTFALLSFATPEERWWMILGLVAAAVSGLSMPAWLLLLAKSLETFNSIGKLVNTIGGDATLEILVDELYQLCWSFAVVGSVALVSGSTYVAIWTYTGEKQALRIRENFVRAAFRQDAAWFDLRGDPQELPTIASNALARINGAIGRMMADTFANLLSAVCCLAVAIGLNANLVSERDFVLRFHYFCFCSLSRTCTWSLLASFCIGLDHVMCTADRCYLHCHH
jgi:ABC-type multidrug transport system fused ATPase/permease subunit